MSKPYELLHGTLVQFGPDWEFHSFQATLNQVLRHLITVFDAKAGSLWAPRTKPIQGSNHQEGCTDQLDRAVDQKAQVAERKNSLPLEMAATTLAPQQVLRPGDPERPQTIGGTLRSDDSRVAACMWSGAHLRYGSLTECSPTICALSNPPVVDAERVSKARSCSQPDLLERLGLEATWCLHIPLRVSAKLTEQRALHDGAHGDVTDRAEVLADLTLVATLDGKNCDMADTVTEPLQRVINLCASQVNRALWVESELLQQIAEVVADKMSQHRGASLQSFQVECARLLGFHSATLFARLRADEYLATVAGSSSKQAEGLISLAGSGPAARAYTTGECIIAEENWAPPSGELCHDQWLETEEDGGSTSDGPNQVLCAPVTAVTGGSSSAPLGVLRLHNRVGEVSGGGSIYYPLNALDQLRARRAARSAAFLLHIVREADSKERLLSMVRHDYRVPAANIRTIAANFVSMTDEQLRVRLPLLKERLRLVMDEASDMILISDIARMGLDSQVPGLQSQLKPRDVHLARVIEPILMFFTRSARSIGLVEYSTIDFDRASSSMGVVVFVDPRALRIALYNLLDNALKYSFSDSPVRVAIERRLSALGTQAGVAVVVENYGEGIAESERHKVFVQGFRGSSSRAGGIIGGGVGLSMATSVAEAMGCRIMLTNLRMPTRFEVFIPEKLIRE